MTQMDADKRFVDMIHYIFVNTFRIDKGVNRCAKRKVDIKIERYC